MKKHNANATHSLLQSVATITEQRDRKRLEDALLATFAELMPFNRLAFYQLESSEQGEELVLVSEYVADSMTKSVSIGSRLQLDQQTDFLSAKETGKEFVSALQDDKGFKVTYPISGSHGITGFLQTYSDLNTESDRKIIYALLKIYSNYLSILLESETDTLTGLLNRRTFDQNIGNIIAERTDPDQPTSVQGKPYRSRRKVAVAASHWLAIIDIDHFKQVNDVYGHLYGDEVLLLMARNMRRVFRQKDKLFRFGGEEFVVVLDRTSLENAREVLERFRKTIENYNFPQIGKITVSIGFVCLAKDEVPSVIVGHADQALYYAKHHGRNRVCQYERLVSTGKLAGQQYSEDMQLF